MSYFCSRSKHVINTIRRLPVLTAIALVVLAVGAGLRSEDGAWLRLLCPWSKAPDGPATDFEWRDFLSK